MTRKYELMVVYGPDVGADALPEKMDALKSLIEREGAAVTEVEDWGRRRLGYPINQRFEGQYVLAYFDGEAGQDNHELERELSIDESVLRHLLVRLDR